MTRNGLCGLARRAAPAASLAVLAMWGPAAMAQAGPVLVKPGAVTLAGYSNASGGDTAPSLPASVSAPTAAQNVPAPRPSVSLPGGVTVSQPSGIFSLPQDWDGLQDEIDSAVRGSTSCDARSYAKDLGYIQARRERFDAMRRAAEESGRKDSADPDWRRDRDWAQSVVEAFDNILAGLPPFRPCDAPPIADGPAGEFHIGAFADYAFGKGEFDEATGGTGTFDMTGREFGIDVGYTRRLNRELGLGIAIRYIWSNLRGGSRVNCAPGCDASTPHRAEALATFSYDLGPVTTYVAGGITLVHVEADVGGFPGNAEDATGPVFGLGIAIPIAPKFVFDLNVTHYSAEAKGICDQAACGGAAGIKTQATVFGAELKVIM